MRYAYKQFVSVSNYMNSSQTETESKIPVQLCLFCTHCDIDNFKIAVLLFTLAELAKISMLSNLSQCFSSSI